MNTKIETLKMKHDELIPPRLRGERSIRAITVTTFTVGQSSKDATYIIYVVDYSVEVPGELEMELSTNAAARHDYSNQTNLECFGDTTHNPHRLHQLKTMRV